VLAELYRRIIDPTDGINKKEAGVKTAREHVLELIQEPASDNPSLSNPDQKVLTVENVETMVYTFMEKWMQEQLQQESSSNPEEQEASSNPSDNG